MAVTRSKLALSLAALLAWAGHLALAAYFVAPATLTADRPIDGADFDTHIGQTYRVIEGLDRWGKPWVYDVQLLAGQPEGTIFDADNKGWELWTFVGWKLGLSKAHAFNSFVACAHAFAPVLVACAAALLGLAPWTCLLAGVMASTVWWFDSWTHWAWWIGMVSYATASVAFLVPLALFHRFALRRSRLAGVVFAPVLALCHLLHPYSFFMLAVPLAVLYLRKRTSFERIDHALVALAVVVTLALNAPWLLPAAQHWHYILDSAFFGRTGIVHLVADFFDVLHDPTDSGVIGTRTGFRFTYLSMAVAVLLVWRRARDERATGLFSALLALFVLGYLGSYLPGAAQIQPYRHLIPLSFLGCVLAAAFVEQLVRERALHGLGRTALALVAVLGLGAAQHLVRQAMYFMPSALPAVAPLIDGTPSPFAASGHPPFPSYRIPREIDGWLRLTEMAQWVSANVPRGERVLVEETHLGERLAWRTGAEVLGGFRQRNIAHSYANFFRHYEDKLAPRDALTSYLRTYAVRWIIASSKRGDFEQARELLEPIGPIFGRYVYKVRAPQDKVLAGRGQVRATTNRIEVRGSLQTEPLVLSYHFHEKLVCEPICSVLREPSPFDAVGLIRIPAPHPPDMVISLRY